MSGNNIVVYTAIFGCKDFLIEQPEVEGVDYVCFTDHKYFRASPWKLKVSATNGTDPRKAARKFKVLPHVYFPEYEYSIWIDGNKRLEARPDDLISQFLAEESLATFRHASRDCLYQEAQVCMERRKDDPQIIRKQIDRYLEEGYPQSNGLAESSMILRRHNDPAVVATMNDWWAELNSYSMRDQVSFNYAAYRNNLHYKELPGTAGHNELVSTLPHYYNISPKEKYLRIPAKMLMLVHHFWPGFYYSAKRARNRFRSNPGNV